MCYIHPTVYIQGYEWTDDLITFWYLINAMKNAIFNEVHFPCQLLCCCPSAFPTADACALNHVDILLDEAKC